MLAETPRKQGWLASLAHRKASNEAMQWLARLQSPNLESTQERAFFEWLEKSASHQAAYLQAEQLWERGDVLVKVEHSRTVLSEFNFWPITAPLVAVAALLLLIFIDPISSQVFETQLGEQRQLVLDDGSRVFLNTDSQLLVEISKHQRHVTLQRGEAFFDVFKDPNKPFTVEFKQGQVLVLGTQFAIHLERSQPLVTVLEGKVAVSARETGEEFGAVQTLSANQQVAIAESSIKAVQSVDARKQLSWRNKTLVFDNAVLSDVIADLNRYYPQKILIADPRLANKRVIANIRLLDFASTLETLTLSLNLSSRKLADGHVELSALE